jgi:transketolase
MNASARLPAATADRRRLANALSFLAIDVIEAAKSGHPGMPMGMADIAEVLWRDHLKHDPAAPRWADRDRFVLSNGHGSMRLYALPHLSGYDLPLEELKRFRQLHAKTPDHPEVGLTPGVETTTGVPRVAVGAAHPDFWRKYVGLEGRVIGIASFGESAPAAALYEHFGLTANAVADAVAAVVADADRPLAA